MYLTCINFRDRKNNFKVRPNQIRQTKNGRTRSKFDEIEQTSKFQKRSQGNQPNKINLENETKLALAKFFFEKLTFIHTEKLS